MSEQPSTAIRQLQQQASAGDLHAAAQLGVYFLVGYQVPRDTERGFLCIKEAAEQGDIASQTLLATLYAAGMGTIENWEDAYNWLVVGAQNGDPKAQGQIAYFLPDLKSPEIKMTWQDVRKKLSAIPDEFDFNYTVHHSKPLVRTQENFLDQRTCQYVMASAQPFLKQAYVNDGSSGAQFDQSRTNSAMSFYPLENDLVIQKINKKISTFLAQPVSHGEALSVLHYKAGQSYEDHYDYFNPAHTAHAQHLKLGGQRTRTFLIYLNDAFSEGETSFPKLNWKFKGKQGDALVFDNVASNGELLENSLHTGLPPKAGEKWVISKWLKDKPQY